MANLCADCNKPTEQPTHARCNACKQKRYRDRRKKGINPIHCIQCKTLIGYEGDISAAKKFCSQKCRQAAYMGRQREAVVARSKLQAEVKQMEWPRYLEHQRQIEVEKNEAGELQVKLQQSEMMKNYWIEELNKQEILTFLLVGVSIILIILLLLSWNHQITDMLPRIAHF